MRARRQITSIRPKVTAVLPLGGCGLSRGVRIVHSIVVGVGYVCQALVRRCLLQPLDLHCLVNLGKFFDRFSLIAYLELFYLDEPWGAEMSLMVSWFSVQECDVRFA